MIPAVKWGFHFASEAHRGVVRNRNCVSGTQTKCDETGIGKKIPDQALSDEGCFTGGVLKAGFLVGIYTRRPKDLSDASSIEALVKNLYQTGPWTRCFVVLTVTEAAENSTRRFQVRLNRFLSPDSKAPVDFVDLHNSVIKEPGNELHIVSDDLIWILTLFQDSEFIEWTSCIKDSLEEQLQPYTLKMMMQKYGQICDSIHQYAAELDENDTDDSSEDSKELQLKQNCTQNGLRDLFGSDCVGDERICEALFSEGSRRKSVRSVFWRRLLGLLGKSVDLWLENTVEMRKSYVCSAKKHIVNECLAGPNLGTIEESTLEGKGWMNEKIEHVVNSPLMAVSGFPEVFDSEFSAKAASETTLGKEVMKDIERTNVFSEELDAGFTSNRELIFRVTFVWSKEHPEVGYIQGMCDILSVIVHALKSEYESVSTGELKSLDSLKDPSDSACYLFQILTDALYVEHDTYQLFDRILLNLLPVYHPSYARPGSALNSHRFAPTLISRLEHIQHRLLQRSHPELAAHLHVIGIRPELYLIRWMRTLFAREVRIPLLYTIWDAIISKTPDDFLMLDSVCVAILLTPRVCAPLMHSTDVSEALQAIKKLPSLTESEITEIICSATRIHLTNKVSAMMMDAELGKQSIQTAVSEMMRSNGTGYGNHEQGLNSGFAEELGDSIDEDWIKVNAMDSDVKMDFPKSKHKGLGKKLLGTLQGQLRVSYKSLFPTSPRQKNSK